jgi:hypothetical protein
MARTVTLHKKEFILNRKKLKNILDNKGISYSELHEKVVDKFGLDITYKGFMSLLSNRSTWKSLYSHAITEVLLVTTNDIFEVVDVDIEKKAKEKEEWKEKYQKD